MNDTQYYNLQQAIYEWYDNTDNNIVSVGLCHKITNNIVTDNLSIRFSVESKKPVSQLSGSEILPKSLNINGTEYPTDVVEQQMELSVNPCHSWDPPDALIVQHRRLQNPLVGGVSIGRNDELGAGTLGGICVDDIDKTIIGLTNNHVIIENGFLNSSRNFYNPNSQNSNTRYINSIASDMMQPGLLELVPAQRIGPIKRYYPLSHQGPNYIDAAIISINNSFINNSSYGQLNNTSLTYAPVFATTQEINSLLLSPKPKLYKSGRTTGFIGGDICPLEAISIMESVSVGGYSPYNASVPFADLIVYRFAANNSNGRPLGGASIPGDSGSLVLAEFNGIQKIIGLNFAGGRFQTGDPEGNAGIACRIDRVSSLLNITHWNGVSMRFSNPSTDWTYYEDNSSANNITIINNGKNYWQIGTS